MRETMIDPPMFFAASSRWAPRGLANSCKFPVNRDRTDAAMPLRWDMERNVQLPGAASGVLFEAAALTSREVLTLVVCALGLAIDLIEISIGNALSPLFSASPYRLDRWDLSWVLSSVYAGAVIGSPLIGRMAERWGLHNALRALVLWFAGTATLCALSPSPFWLGFSRLLSGIALGAYPPIMIAYLAQILPPRLRGGLVFAASGLAYLGTPCAIFLLRTATVSQPLGIAPWRWPFAFAAITAMGITLLARRLPAARSAGSSQVPEIQPAGTLRLRRRFWLIATIFSLWPWASVAFPIVTGPALLGRGVGLNDTLLYVGLSTFGPTLGTLITGPLIDRIERRASVVLFAALLLVSAVLFVNVRAPAAVVTAAFMFNMGVALYTPAMMVYGAELFPTTSRASATSTAWALNRLSAALVPAAVVPLLQVSSPESVVNAVLAVLALIIALVLAFGPGGKAGHGVE